jgi:DHA2 family methylenomycin A resistance protein-like MFS transporter
MNQSLNTFVKQSKQMPLIALCLGFFMVIIDVYIVNVTLPTMAKNLGVYGILFLLPLYFQHVRGYSVFMTGLAIAPLSALAAICSYFAGRLVSVAGSKIIMIIGLSIGAFGFFMMLFAGEYSPYMMLLLPLILIGVGGSLTMPAATIGVINSAPEGRAGLASGAFNTSRQIGSLVGVS